MLKIAHKLHTEKRSHGIFVTVFGGDSEILTRLGEWDADKLSAAYRVSVCWMAVKNDGTVPEETQYLMLKKGDCYTLVFALACNAARSSLYAEGKNLYVRTETYDTSTAVGATHIAYVISGTNPYRLVDTAYAEMQAELKTFSCKGDKPAPAFADYFGFCTYNALCASVTEENLVKSLTMFRDGGIPVGFVIADDGWQMHEGNMLTGFCEDAEKFPDGLHSTIGMLKREFGLKKFLCWHTYNGYWQGVKAAAFPELQVKTEYFTVPSRFKSEVAVAGGTVNTVTGCFYPDNIIDLPCGFPQGELYDFYKPFYEKLSASGVDGSKLDAMAWVEAFSQGKGGRVAMTANMVRGLERASREAFGGNHINCSSCSNDFFYNTHNEGVTRVSTDYFPDDKNSYFHHIYSSASVCFWTQPILFGDWDMFQSGNAAGALHAKARAISGGPVYCSDNAETFDASVLRPLVSESGKVAKCLYDAVPSEDCLFLDNEEKRPLKLFNATPCAYVLGAFNCKSERVEGDCALCDIDGLPQEKYAVYSDVRGFMGVKNHDDSLHVALNGFEAEVFTVSPVINGAAVVGLKGAYNPSGFVKDVCANGETLTLVTADDGEYLVYLSSQNGLVSVKSVNGKATVRLG